MTRQEIEALAADLGRFPKIRASLGERILNVPEGVTEEFDEVGPPAGFTRESFNEFMGLYSKFRCALTGKVAAEIGHSVANEIIDGVHKPIRKRCPSE